MFTVNVIFYIETPCYAIVKKTHYSVCSQDLDQNDDRFSIGGPFFGMFHGYGVPYEVKKRRLFLLS